MRLVFASIPVPITTANQDGEKSLTILTCIPPSPLSFTYKNIQGGIQLSVQPTSNYTPFFFSLEHLLRCSLISKFCYDFQQLIQFEGFWNNLVHVVYFLVFQLFVCVIFNYYNFSPFLDSGGWQISTCSFVVSYSPYLVFFFWKTEISDISYP